MAETNGPIADFQRAFEDKLNEEFTKLKKPNVLVAGRTGVGKSSLINAVFGTEIAKVGAGRPVTQFYVSYPSDNVLVNLFDSKGWEGGAADERAFFQDTALFLSSHRTDDIANHIHIVWYALDASGARFTDFDAKIVREAFAGIPVLFVLTKCDVASDDQVAAMRKAIADGKLSNVVGVVEVSADPLVKRGKRLCDPFGLTEVVKRTLDLLPELVRRAFISAQRVSLRLKDDESKSSIVKFVAASFGVGFAPLPFADAPILATMQAGMVARIAVIYGFRPGATLLASVGALASGAVASAVGLFLANLLKLIPGIGSIIGGLINGALAGSITGAVGFSFRRLFHEIVAQTLAGNEGTITEGWMKSYLQDGFDSALQVFRGGKKADEYDDL